MTFRHYIIFVLLFLTVASYSQTQTAKKDSVQSKSKKMLLVPIVFYTPESNFAFGGGGQLFFKTKNSTSKEPNSNILASVIYTLNKQFIAEVSSEVYFKNENYFLDASLGYKILPNPFWGIGQDTPESAKEGYSQTEMQFSAAFLKKLPRHVNFGFEFNFKDYDVTEIQEGGLLDSGTIEGADGATLLGLGIVLNIDSRDNKFSPLGGHFLQFKTNFTSKVLGSTHSFNTYYLDFRKYLNIGNNNHILALQLYTRLTFGNSPFQAKAYYGGADVARGFFKGRYIDDNLYVVQMEYRLPILKRFELAAFVLTGNVGNSTKGQGLFEDFKSSFGFGPRYFIYKDKRTLLRLDVGINDRGEKGIYFGINEAF